MTMSMLSFPDTARPCKDFHWTGGCARANCPLIHEQGSSLLTLTRVVDLAQTSMDIAVATITCDELADAVLAAHARGVAVRVITKGFGARGVSPQIQSFIDAGIPVRDALINLTVRSFEWIHEAVTDYYDMAMISHHDAMIESNQNQLDDIWRRDRNFRFEDDFGDEEGEGGDGLEDH